MKVLFLHLPKTAGQSVHQYLIDLFTNEQVCPARVNEQYSQLSDDELDRYTVYSGHVDWSRFDNLESPFFTFSILRDPLERLLSFYFYLREQADLFEARGELDSMPGVKAAKVNTPYEFFICPNNPHRNFIDQTLDNLYTYYFAGRQYTARNRLKDLVGAGNCFKSGEHLIRLAQMNIQKDIDAVYGIGSWKPKLQSDLQSRFGFEDIEKNTDYVINRGKTAGVDRLDLLRDLGGTDEVEERVRQMCSLDYKLIEKLGLDI